MRVGRESAGGESTRDDFGEEGEIREGGVGVLLELSPGCRSRDHETRVMISSFRFLGSSERRSRHRRVRTSGGSSTEDEFLVRS